MKPLVVWAAAFLTFPIIFALAEATDQSDRPERQRIKLNKVAIAHARRLIAEHHLVNDKHGEWRQHKPSTQCENNFIQGRGFEEYSRWHLGLDESHSAKTKGRYHFPFGDFSDLHRCALIAAQNRARQYHYDDVETAVSELLDLINNANHD
jgi:hypothetical protein